MPELWTVIFSRLPLWLRPLVGTTCRTWYSVLANMPSEPLSCDGPACEGWFGVLKWAYARGCAYSSNLGYFAAMRGDLVMLKYVHDVPLDACTMSIAATGGHLEVIKWLAERGCPADHMTAVNAAQSGHLDILKWICSMDVDSTDSNNPLVMLRLYFTMTADLIYSAASESGHVHICEWIREFGEECLD
jgi:hypothetical protein